MTTPTTAPRRRPRLDPDTRGGLRLTLAAAGVLILVVPFALLLLLVVDHWGPLQRLDHDLAARLNAYAFPHPGYVTFLKVITTVGHPAAFEAVTVAVTIWLLTRRRPRLAVWLAVTVFGGGLLSTIVKNAVGRKRPLLPHPVAHAISASFPSGHAIGSVVGVGALLLVFLPYARRSARPAWIAVGCLVVLAIGFSRLGLGLHYLSDVLGGYILGAGWLAVSTAAFTAWRTAGRSCPHRLLTDLCRRALPRRHPRVTHRGHRRCRTRISDPLPDRPASATTSPRHPSQALTSLARHTPQRARDQDGQPSGACCLG